MPPFFILAFCSWMWTPPTGSLDLQMAAQKSLGYRLADTTPGLGTWHLQACVLPRQADKAHWATLAARYLLEHFPFTADSRRSHKVPGREELTTLSRSSLKQTKPPTSTCYRTAVPPGGSSQLCLAQPRKKLELVCEISTQVTLQSLGVSGIFSVLRPRFPGSTLLHKAVRQRDFGAVFNSLDHIWISESISSAHA